jgi:hypothetical protein
MRTAGDGIYDMAPNIASLEMKNDDQTENRKRDSFYFLTYAERWIRSGMTVLQSEPRR